ncbi:MAG: aminopeptidase [Candidatus Lokiarchaeota archaeon]|nr:aminopeptidase [Candidatus Lokiarchaeota archaeon]
MSQDNSNKKKESDLEEELLYELDFAWNLYSNSQKLESKELAEKYIEFLTKARTERERTAYIKEKALQRGFREVEIGNSDAEGAHKLKPGDRIFYTNRKKNISLVIVGSHPLSHGLNIIGAHLDTPRVDLKIRPLYEDKESGFALFKTHYYGGVKKYQWASIPLILTGVVVKKNGTVIDVDIGTNDNDPVFIIPDLLPHLQQKVQQDRKTTDVIKGEEMNVLVGAIPHENKNIKQKFKVKILQILHEKYDIKEEDFLSAELSLVPAFKPRFVGIDKSMIGASGQDDGICSFLAMQSILDIKEIPEKTIIAALFDKEEIGSSGSTGAKSSWLRFLIEDLLLKKENHVKSSKLNISLTKTKIISADVGPVLHPTFKQVQDPRTAAILGKGLRIMKYTGRAGKVNSSDATAEFIAELRHIFDENEVPFQLGAFSAVDAGGGGTIAMYFAEQFNADVVDAGPAVLNIHSPYEISHIADIYASYLGYRTFFKHI